MSGHCINIKTSQKIQQKRIVRTTIGRLPQSISLYLVKLTQHVGVVVESIKFIILMVMFVSMK